MKSCLIFFAIVATVAATPSGTDYCKLNCLKNGTELKHIACDNNNEFDPDCPKDPTIININKHMKDFLTEKLSYMRNLAAGGGGNSSLETLPVRRMGTVHWNDELAELAVLSAKRCFPLPDFCRRTEAFSNPVQYSLEVFLKYNNNVYERIKELFEKHFIKYNISGKKYFDIIFHDGNIHFGCGAANAPPAPSYCVTETESDTYWFVCNFAAELENPKAVFNKEDVELILRNANIPVIKRRFF